MIESLYKIALLIARDDDGSISLSDGPPPRRQRVDNQQTLLVSWWCTGFALAFILVRLWGRAERVGKLFVEDKIMALSIIPLLIRMACAHVVLLYGTNNSQTDGASEQELYHRSIGARVVLVSRIFYALFIWTAKWTVSEYLKRITSSIWTGRHQLVLHCIRIFLVITFLGVVIGTLSECQPFDHYWQVVPDPGPNCRNGYAQLLVMGISDIITDIILIAFPIQLVLTSSFSLKRKIGLSLLFSFSLFLIAITAYRMPTIIEAKGRQQLRTLWASIEILAASIVANALVLGSFVRDKGAKRAKYRGARGTIRNRNDSAANGFEPSINRVMTKQHWGNDSDENLFKSCRGRLDSVSETVASGEASTFTRPLWSSNSKACGKESDTSSHALEEEDEEEDIEATAGARDPASSKDYYAPITPPEAARKGRAAGASDVDTSSPKSLPQQSDAFSALANGGGLLHYSPPPTAHGNRRGKSPAEEEMSDEFAEIRQVSSDQQSLDSIDPVSRPSRVSLLATEPRRPQTLARIESQGASLSIEDPGGLLSPVKTSTTVDSDEVSPTTTSPPKKSARRLWLRPSRTTSAGTFMNAPVSSTTQRGPTSPGRDPKHDPMALQDPGGLLKL